MENGAKPDQRVAVAVENRGDVAGATRLAVVPHASTQGLTSFVRGVIDLGGHPKAAIDGHLKSGQRGGRPGR